MTLSHQDGDDRIHLSPAWLGVLWTIGAGTLGGTLTILILVARLTLQPKGDYATREDIRELAKKSDIEAVRDDFSRKLDVIIKALPEQPKNSAPQHDRIGRRP